MQYITKEEAKEKGLKKYIGRECIHGHICERYVINDLCSKCERDRQRAVTKGRVSELAISRRLAKIAKNTAIAAGLNKYSTGISCKNGHVAERYTSDGSCVLCSCERHQQRRSEKADSIREWARIYSR